MEIDLYELLNILHRLEDGQVSLRVAVDAANKWVMRETVTLVNSDETEPGNGEGYDCEP